MLWLMATLLSLVDDVFSDEDITEAHSDVQHVLRQPSLSSAEGQAVDSDVHLPWPDTFGESSNIYL